MEQNVSKRIEALEETLKDPDEGVREKAAESLSRIEARADFDTYILMLGRDDRATKIQAIYHLAELATEPAIELLRLQIRDPYDDVRAAVIQALGNSSNNYTTREIRQKAVDIALMGLEDVNLSIRASAADTLARFKDPRSARALLALITTSTKDEADDAQPVVRALLALGEIGGSKLVPDIIEKAKTDSLEIKEAALKVLGMLGDPRAEGCLIEALTSDDARIRMQAAESLGYIDFGL
jgi:HEAT repeat protein